MVRMVQKDVYILYSDLPLKSRNNVMHPRYSSSMHSFGAMKVAFYKASLLRKRRAVDKSKRKYEWSEWSKRTYTYYIVSYHCNGHNNLRVLTYPFYGKDIVYDEIIVISSYISFLMYLGT